MSRALVLKTSIFPVRVCRIRYAELPGKEPRLQAFPELSSHHVSHWIDLGHKRRNFTQPARRHNNDETLPLRLVGHVMTSLRIPSQYRSPETTEIHSRQSTVTRKTCTHCVAPPSSVAAFPSNTVSPWMLISETLAWIAPAGRQNRIVFIVETVYGYLPDRSDQACFGYFRP